MSSSQVLIIFVVIGICVPAYTIVFCCCLCIFYSSQWFFCIVVAGRSVAVCWPPSSLLFPRWSPCLVGPQRLVDLLICSTTKWFSLQILVEKTNINSKICYWRSPLRLYQFFAVPPDQSEALVRCAPLTLIASTVGKYARPPLKIDKIKPREIVLPFEPLTLGGSYRFPRSPTPPELQPTVHRLFNMKPAVLADKVAEKGRNAKTRVIAPIKRFCEICEFSCNGPKQFFDQLQSRLIATCDKQKGGSSLHPL